MTEQLKEIYFSEENDKKPKALITIPNSLFKETEKFVKKFGISRNELYIEALRAYFKAKGQKMITEKLDQIYEIENSQIDVELMQIQVMSIGDKNW